MEVALTTTAVLDNVTGHSISASNRDILLVASSTWWKIPSTCCRLGDNVTIAQRQYVWKTIRALGTQKVDSSRIASHYRSFAPTRSVSPPAGLAMSASGHCPRPPSTHTGGTPRAQAAAWVPAQPASSTARPVMPTGGQFSRPMSTHTAVAPRAQTRPPNPRTRPDHHKSKLADALKADIRNHHKSIMRLLEQHMSQWKAIGDKTTMLFNRALDMDLADRRLVAHTLELITKRRPQTTSHPWRNPPEITQEVSIGNDRYLSNSCTDYTVVFVTGIPGL
jgi:hypothetical protein